MLWLQLKLVVDKGHGIENVYMGESPYKTFYFSTFTVTLSKMSG